MAKKKKTRKTRRTGSFVLGLVLLLFAAFGIYEAVHLTVDKVSSLRDGSARYAEYETFLKPFVVIDPAPFDDVRSADATDLLDASISALIQNSDKINTYDVFEGEITGLLVPQADVEAYFVQLFGNEVQMAHQSVSDSCYNVIYNSERKAYIIPITSVDPLYTPKVFDAEKTGSSVTLTVGYIIGSEWAQLERGNYTAPEPAKYMKITLREDGSSYHIGSLRNSEAVETAEPVRTTAPSTTQAAVTSMPSTESETVLQTAAETSTGGATYPLSVERFCAAAKIPQPVRRQYAANIRRILSFIFCCGVR